MTTCCMYTREERVCRGIIGITFVFFFFFKWKFFGFPLLLTNIKMYISNILYTIPSNASACFSTLQPRVEALLKLMLSKWFHIAPGSHKWGPWNFGKLKSSLNIFFNFSNSQRHFQDVLNALNWHFEFHFHFLWCLWPHWSTKASSCITFSTSLVADLV